jgi:hypothetical protein
MIWLLTHPLPLFSKFDRKTKKKRQLANGRWGVVGTRTKSQLIRRAESLVLYKSFNTLWMYAKKI